MDFNFNNPTWKSPNMIDQDEADFFGAPDLSTSSPVSSATLTDADTTAKGNHRKDSKRGSGASTPARDAVAGFLHDGSYEASRATSAVTTSGNGCLIILLTLLLINGSSSSDDAPGCREIGRNHTKIRQ
jgi:hypothetical protein